MSETSTHDLHTTGEAGRRLGLSAPHIGRLCAEGRIASSRIGGRYLISGEEIDRVAAERGIA